MSEEEFNEESKRLDERIDSFVALFLEITHTDLKLNQK